MYAAFRHTYRTTSSHNHEKTSSSNCNTLGWSNVKIDALDLWVEPAAGADAVLVSSLRALFTLWSSDSNAFMLAICHHQCTLVRIKSTRQSDNVPRRKVLITSSQTTLYFLLDFYCNGMTNGTFYSKTSNIISELTCEMMTMDKFTIDKPTFKSLGVIRPRTHMQLPINILQ